ncbi:NAD-dependent epimerase/dehydratase family protein [Paenibacillus aurantius]|uniref:NAD-dependent epimerase/dehydratase family protein n=1 Tax=Paenibacillus aurantius TaxID=2918900 RepID=A0AA96LEQ4_9BACL|nr:NAD-dependent epimerase/dehydratase family protein [Paenibacillus aurantius]WNQ12381.1 NAD-dependent epimerase/dehydratase family protein [Paenibacillus aurantius]
MKVLILGGTGVISSQISQQLLAAGHEVTVFNRGSKSLPDAGQYEWIVGSKADGETFQRQMAGRRFDAVIDMISFNEPDARLTVETFRGRVPQLIFCSTGAAYKRPFRTTPVKEEAEALFDDPAFPYAYDKARMELYLQSRIREENLAVTIIRPSLTYGVGGANLGVLRQNYNIVHRIRQGLPLVMFGDGRLPWSFTFAPDLAKAFVGAVGNERTYGQAYHATSEENRVWDDLYGEWGQILGAEPVIVHLPTDLLLKADPDLFAHLHYEKSYAGLFDNAKIKRDIPDFQISLTLRDGLRMMLDWYEAEGHTLDEGKMRLEDELTAIHSRWSREMEELELS